jgi:transposase
MRFISNLSQETQKILRRFYQQSRNHRVRQRAHCILLSFQGMTIDNLIKVFNTDRLTISHWLNAWEERHLSGLYDHKRPGRPQKLTVEEQQKIPQYVEQYPQNLKKVAHVIEQETHKSVSTKTIKRFIKKNVLPGKGSENLQQNTRIRKSMRKANP